MTTLSRLLNIVATITLLASCLTHAEPTVSITPIDAATSTITLTFNLKEGQYIHKNYLDVSIDHPDITLSTWQASAEPIDCYDPTFKENKMMFKDSFSISFNATKKRAGIDAAHLHCFYYLTTNKKITENVIKVPLAQPSPTAALSYSIDVAAAEIADQQAIVNKTAPTSPTSTHHKQEHSWLKAISCRVSTLAQTTDSLWLQLMLVFLLGMLLSFTPCIYPMIPITIGILHSRGGNSVGANFITSLTYVTGIASTFALLGLLAASTGQMFGAIMCNPIVIAIIVALLIYLACAMLGFYEMYLPRSLQNQNSSVKKGSLLSVFLFGAISGSVASPCLSPGLILLLGIVTTLGNKLLGFLLLFSFGIGLGLPLMIIGTFSSSLAILPRAGIWMIEIKKVFGLILLAMCFYFLNAILSPMLILGGLTGFLLIAGVWYLYDVKNTPSKSWRLAKNLVGMLMVAGSIVMAAYTYKASAMSCSAEESIWLTDYTQAHERARAENKKLFVDIGAPFCTLCAAIDKSLLHHQAVQCALARYITVKIDGSRENDAIVTLKTKYQVLGFPTFLLIDPTDDTLITRWAGELYERSPEDFARELERLA